MNPLAHNDRRQLLDAFDSMKNELNQLTSKLKNNSSYIETENRDLALRISGEYLVSEMHIGDDLFLLGKESFEEKLVIVLNQAIKTRSERAKQEIAGISTESYMAALREQKQDNYSDWLRKYQKKCGEINSKMEKEIYSFSSLTGGIRCSVTGALIITEIDINERDFNISNKSSLETELSDLINKAIIETRNKASKELIEFQKRAFTRR